MTKLIITGAKGRMGQTLLACAMRESEFQVVGQIDLGDNLESIIATADVVVDFSFHDATAGIAELSASNRKALVIGTTGHSPDEKAKITSIARTIPVVWSSNYSTGVNTLFWLARVDSQR